MTEYIVVLETKRNGQILVRVKAETPVEAIEKVTQPGAWPTYPVVAIARVPFMSAAQGRSTLGTHLRKVVTKHTPSYKIEGEV